MGYAIKRSDGTYRGWFAWGLPVGMELGDGETWEERETPPEGFGGQSPPPE